MPRPDNAFEKIVSLSKRRGFIFQSSEVYGGLGSTWDYGPLGVELKNNVKKAWWKSVVYQRDDMEGLDAAIIMNRLVWQYSGHEKTFVDPLVDCKECRKRFRADKITTEYPKEIVENDITIQLDQQRILIARFGSKEARIEGCFSLPCIIKNKTNEPQYLTNVRLITNEFDVSAETKPDNISNMEAEFYSGNLKIKKEDSCRIQFWFPGYKLPNEIITPKDALLNIWLSNRLNPYVFKVKIVSFKDIENNIIDKCPECAGELTDTRLFNLMFQTYVGPVQDESGLAYLRPETAQGIFANFLNVLQSMRRKLPFGIAQIGKAFRNEITPGNFTFRTREFEQMEIEYFCKPPQYLQPGEKTDDQLHQEWVEARYNWYIGLGMNPERLKKRPQAREELAHYAKACVDLEYLFPGSLGWSELEGVANRQDYDLTAHSNNVNDSDLQRLKLSKNQHSTEKMEYFDEAYVDPTTGKKGAKYIPYVIEPSAGADRATLAFLCEAYNEEQLSQPSDEALPPLKEAAAAALKSIGKKIAEAQKKPGQDGPTLEQLQAIEKSLQAAIDKLPNSLLEIDAACSLPWADRIELLKKVRQLNGKLCDEHTRAVLKLHPELAPIKVAVLPLKKNEPEIVETARRIKTLLQPTLRTIYDDTAGIGKLYRRQDEIGTPFCVTVDFQALQDQTVTLRDRDSMGQERHKIEELVTVIEKKMTEWRTR